MLTVIGRTNPKLAPDGTDYRAKLIQYIKDNFSDVLGSNLWLLDIPGGLDVLQAIVRKWIAEIRTGTVRE